MYQNPTLFPQISNRESWLQTCQIFDDDTGDLITLVDGSGNALFAVTLEIRRSRDGSGGGGYSGPSPYYDDWSCEPVIYSTLAQGAPAIAAGNYIAIVDSGTISIQIPRSIMLTLHQTGTYDVFLTVEDTAGDDSRQILIGRLPVFFGGRNT
jgi:hypothetical protein